MLKTFEDIGESGIEEVINYLLSIRPFPEIITLSGDLGAGKTTLVKKLLAALGTDDKVSSPTFSLINEYHTHSGDVIYHSDWYRVKNIAELYDAGIDEYIDSGNKMIIEWPEVGAALLKDVPHLAVEILHRNHSRTYKLSF